MSKYGAWAFNVSIYADTNEDAVYTNMPSANSFLFNSYRHVTLVDLSGMSSVRMIVNKQSVAGSAGSKLSLKYSDTFSTNPDDYSNIGVDPVEILIDTENSILTTNWTQILAPQNDVFLAVIGSGGDGNITPHFGHISVNFG